MMTAQQKQDLAQRVHLLMQVYVHARTLESSPDRADFKDVSLPRGLNGSELMKLPIQFEDYNVPFDPDVKDVYRILGAMECVGFRATSLASPSFVLFKEPKDMDDYISSDIPFLMDSHHLWPGEEPNEFQFMMIGYSFFHCLTIGENGKWSVKAYDGDGGGMPKEGDFTLSFFEAFMIYSSELIDLFANGIDKDYDGDLYQNLKKEIQTGQITQRSLDFAHQASLLDISTLARQEVEINNEFDLVEEIVNQPKTMMSFEFYQDDLVEGLRVVGLAFGDYKQAFEHLKKGTKLRLQCVDDNEFDPNAIEVWHDGDVSLRLGFIPKDINKEIRVFLNEKKITPHPCVMDATPEYLLIDVLT